jgi:hypothetical protein
MLDYFLVFINITMIFFESTIFILYMWQILCQHFKVHCESTFFKNLIQSFNMIPTKI